MTWDLPRGTIQLAGFKVVRLHRDCNAAATICERGGKEFRVPNAAVELTVTGVDGSTIVGLITIDEAVICFGGIPYMLTDA
jgi:hypothetical protein